MDTPTDRQQPRWKTYNAAFLLLIPALCAWKFTSLFLVPKSRIIWGESGFNTSDGLLSSIMRFGHQSFAYLNWMVLALIVVFVGMELRSMLTPQRRRWLLGGAMFAMNAMVFGGLICLVISFSVVTPVVHKKANFLAHYSLAAGVLPVAEQQWDARYAAFKLGVDDLSISERQQINVLLDVLEGGATLGVCRGTVGSLLRYEQQLRQRPAWGERFLDRASHLADLDLASIDDAVAWYQTVASEPEWQATL